MIVISNDERYEDDLEQVQCILEWTERKETKRRARKMYMDEFREVFRAKPKN